MTVYTNTKRVAERLAARIPCAGQCVREGRWQAERLANGRVRVTSLRSGARWTWNLGRSPREAREAYRDARRACGQEHLGRRHPDSIYRRPLD